MAEQGTDVTALLQRWHAGDAVAREQVFTAVYSELRSIARRQLASERAGHTLQATALVNEALIKLLGVDRAHWLNRDHVLALATQAMRRVLVDHARRRAADKRPEPAARVSLAIAEEQNSGHAADVDVLALDRALDELAAIEPRHAQIVELRYFGGLTGEEVAEALGVSLTTVNRDWKVARAWLRVALGA
ncbi:MAG: ECF-type sigma factor [Lysobacterales bacterium]